MTKVNIAALQERAARHPSNHVQRFVPLIEICINALKASGLRLEKRYTNQVLIEGRWIGRYEHGHQNQSGKSRIAIYDGHPQYSDTVPAVAIHNAAEAVVFAQSVAWIKAAIGQSLLNI